MSDSTKLYNALYQNAEIGSSSIRQIFPKVQDSRLKNEMRMQLSNYKEQVNNIAHQMRANNERPRSASRMTKMMTSMGIAMNCARDNSTEHIAEMLIQGTNMGVIKINKALNSAVTADSKLVREAKSMLTKEQRYIDNLKGYL